MARVWMHTAARLARRAPVAVRATKRLAYFTASQPLGTTSTVNSPGSAAGHPAIDEGHHRGVRRRPGRPARLTSVHRRPTPAQLLFVVGTIVLYVKWIPISAAIFGMALLVRRGLRTLADAERRQTVRSEATRP
jgi:hypothetical protein